MSLKKLFTVEIDYKNRMFGFDIMRGIGVLIVVIAHGRDKFEHYLNISTFISILGFWLMDLFFVLSAFLIGSLFIKVYEKQKTFTLGTAYDFWIRRWFRTLPNYYLALILCAILWVIFSGKFVFSNPKFLSYLVFCQSVLTPHPYFIQEAWTLCIEEWFYLMLPLLVLFFHRFFTKPGDMDFVKKNLFLAMLCMFILPNSIRVISSLVDVPYAWIDTSRMVFYRLDAIAFGILSAWVYRFYPVIIKKYANLSGILAIITTTLYFVYFYKVLLSVDANGNDILPESQSFLSDTFFLTFSALAAFFLVVYMIEVKLEKPNWLTNFISVVSIVSYSVYIFHRSVVLYILDKLFPIPEDAHFLNLIMFFVYAAIAIFFAIFVYNIYEHPITNLREKFKRKTA